MPSERFFVHKEDGSLVRLKGRLVRFLDEEPPTGSDKSAIRTALEVSPDAEGLVQADVGTDPQNLVLHGHLGTLAYADADSVSVAELEVESTTGTATTQALTVTDGTDTNFVVQEDGRTGINNSSPGTNANSNADDLVVGNGQEHGITIYSGTGSSGRLFFSDGTGTSTYRGYIRYDHGSNSMLWGTNSSQRWAIDSSGNFVSSGGGIDFGSGASTTLDEYEEGYHDTTVGTDLTGSITLYTTHDRMTYTKLGNIVQINGMFVIQSVSSPTGSLTFSLPFAVPTLDDSAGYVGGSVYFQDYGTTNTSAPFRCSPGTSTMTVFVDSSTLATDDKFAFNFTYRTTAS